MLIHITPSNAFLSLSHGTRDIIFNVHVLDFVWVAIAAAFLLLSFSVHTFFCITLKIWYRSNVASTTKTFFPSPYFFFFFTKTFQKKMCRGSRFSSGFYFWGWFCVSVSAVIAHLSYDPFSIKTIPSWNGIHKTQRQIVCKIRLSTPRHDCLS